MTTPMRPRRRLPLARPRGGRARHRFGPIVDAIEGRLLMSGNTYTVTSLGDAGAGSGLAGDLRYAITQANGNPGSTVDFSVTGTIQLTSALPDLSANLTIDGPDASSLAIAGVNSSIFTVESGVTASISGLTLSKGSYSGRQGGGAINNQGTLMLTNSTLSGDTANGQGGGIFNSGSLTLRGCTVSDDRSEFGGGIYNGSTGSIVATDSTITGDTTIQGGTNRGGGIENQGNISLNDCTLSDDSGNYGGGLDNLRGTATLTGCTISGNSAPLGGAGIYSGTGSHAGTSASLAIASCTFSGNNSSFRGGGLANGGGSTTTLTSCTFSGNAAGLQSDIYPGSGGGPGAGDGAGGGAIENAGGLTLTDCVLSGNTAREGGGLQNYSDGSATLAGCSISGNVARPDQGHGGYGGGIESHGFFQPDFGATATGGLTLENTTVSGNSAADGGGVYAYDSQCTLTDCTVYGNTASSSGGVEFGGISSGIGLVADCTVTGNRATSGAGAGVSDDASNSHGMLLNNSLIAGNTSGAGSSVGPADVSGLVDSRSAYNLIGNGDGVTNGGINNGFQGNLVGSAGRGTVIDADLGPLADNGGPTETVALLAGSPAIDAGSNALAVDPATNQPLADDQRGTGYPRIVGDYVDIGALESSFTTPRPLFTFPAPSSTTYGAATTAISGQIAAGSLVPTGSVFLTLDGVTQVATIDPTTGGFASTFATSGLDVTSSPYAISLFYPGDAGFAASFGTSSLTVSKATPTLTWPKPPAIVYGSALTTAQLDATSSAPGTFSYSPGIGVLLQPGPGQVLTVTFTPSDTADYTTTTGSTTIDVLTTSPTTTTPTTTTPTTTTPTTTTPTTTTPTTTTTATTPTPTTTATRTPTPPPLVLTNVQLYYRTVVTGHGRHHRTKTRFAGFTLSFDEPLDFGGALNAANYRVLQTTGRGRKAVSRPVSFYLEESSTDGVNVVLLGKPSFARGGELILNASGITDQFGDPLVGQTVLTILRGGRGITG